MRRSQHFELVLVGGALALWFLLHSIWNILFEEWIKHELQHRFGLSVAEMIERFGAVGFPALGAIAIVWGLHRYISKEFAKERAAEDISRIEVSPALAPSQEDGFFPAKYIQVSIRAVGNLIGCQVMLSEVASINDGTATIVYNHPQNAAWSGSNEKTIDINDDQEQRANLLSVSRNRANLSEVEWMIVPRTTHPDEGLRLAIRPPGLYRLTVHASAKNSAPAKKYFLLRWTGTLRDVELWEEPS